MENYEILWKSALEILESSISHISFSTYIATLKPIDLIGNTLVLKADTALYANSATRFSDNILDAFDQAKTGLKDFKIYVGNSSTPFYSSKRETDDSASSIDPRFTFDNYVVGNSNRYALAAAKAVADA
ncbi:MAG: hypothetical protein J6T42_00340, partial [Clostridia bacterium]|nr:hypothetical protein [Clostridia bacterium]